MDDALAFLERERCSAILRTRDPEAVLPAMRAAIAGGFRVVEITLTTPGALEAIAELVRDPDLLVGAGTVLDLGDAAAARDAGARFLVSPVVDPDVIGWCRAHDILCIPGTFTPTEMLVAHRAGAPLVKLFPAPPGGPAYVRAVLGPLPFLRIFPTAGVTADNVGDFLAAGAFGAGFVGTLFDAEDLRDRRFERITRRARRMVEAVKAAGS